MPSSNTQTLIAELHNGSLDARYTGISVVNRNALTGSRGGLPGSLSVVFRAKDVSTGHDVAIKFFDPDLQGMAPEVQYRRALFQREAEILRELLGNPRCLQLVQGLSEVQINAQDAAGRNITLTCSYFVLEWLNGDIRHYFQRQNEFDGLTKLLIFRQAVLGVFALHSQDIAHRDLKDDNIMRVTRQVREFVIPIDLGTAIKIDSNPVGTPVDYAQPVGANGYSPLEAMLGLASYRELAKSSDIYALGCLLHDLFNLDLFIVRLIQDPGFLACKTSCWTHMIKFQQGNSKRNQLLKEWAKIVNLTRNQVTLPSIDSDSSTVPASARDQLNVLLQRLTDVSYLHREHKLEKILRMIDSATRSIQNELLDKKRILLRRKLKVQREQTLKRKLERLEQYSNLKN